MSEEEKEDRLQFAFKISKLTNEKEEYDKLKSDFNKRITQSLKKGIYNQKQADKIKDKVNSFEKEIDRLNISIETKSNKIVNLESELRRIEIRSKTLFREAKVNNKAELKKLIFDNKDESKEYLGTVSDKIDNMMVEYYKIKDDKIPEINKDLNETKKILKKEIKRLRSYIKDQIKLMELKK